MVEDSSGRQSNGLARRLDMLQDGSIELDHICTLGERNERNPKVAGRADSNAGAHVCLADARQSEKEVLIQSYKPEIKLEYEYLVSEK